MVELGTYGKLKLHTSRMEEVTTLLREGISDLRRRASPWLMEGVSFLGGFSKESYFPREGITHITHSMDVYTGEKSYCLKYTYQYGDTEGEFGLKYESTEEPFTTAEDVAVRCLELLEDAPKRRLHSLMDQWDDLSDHFRKRDPDFSGEITRDYIEHAFERKAEDVKPKEKSVKEERRRDTYIPMTVETSTTQGYWEDTSCGRRWTRSWRRGGRG